MVRLQVNGEAREIPDLDPSTPLLWVLRDHLQLTGTRYGCGKGLCGSCTVHIEGSPARACITPVQLADGKSVTTIEGLEGQVADALRDAWRRCAVPQCGYCQAGQLMTAEHQLRTTPGGDAQAREAAMQGNLCRCGTYTRIRKAMTQATEDLRSMDLPSKGERKEGGR